MSNDEDVLTRGKTVLATTCTRCHSSKLPEKAFTNFFLDKGCVNKNYMNCWNDYWQWTKSDELKEQMKQLVIQPDFPKDNYL